MADHQHSEDMPSIDAGKASDESIVKTHARLRRESNPGSPVAFFTVLALIVVFVFSWFYVRRYMGEFDAQGYLAEREQIALHKAYQNRPREAVVIDYYAEGESLYSNCMACHQQNGQGLLGVFPPLAGSEYVVGEDASLPVKIILAGLNGPVTVKGVQYNGAMPAFGALGDRAVAGLTTYIRANWGNEGSEVTEEQVAAIREEIGGRAPYTADELKSYFE